jgi:hypothetical protein
LIIPRPENVKNKKIDVYAIPLIEELQDLWIGVQGLDALQPTWMRHFKMRAIVMFIIHDFPSTGIVSNCQHQGYKACPLCGSRIINQWSKELGKPIFEGCWRWL